MAVVVSAAASRCAVCLAPMLVPPAAAGAEVCDLCIGEEELLAAAEQGAAALWVHRLDAAGVR